MKKLIYISVFFIFGILPGCDFGDLNVDPTRLGDASLNEILPSAIVQSARNILSIGGRVSGTIVQHFTGVEAQPLSYTTYLIDEQTLTDFWETGLYAGAMKDCAIIIQKAEEEDQPFYEGIGKVLMAFNLGIATSYWGDVPFSQALKGTASLKTPYDTQESVYGSIQTLLDEAIIAFEKEPVIGGPAVDDLIFGGDPIRWKATAYALKARYIMHLSKRRENAAVEALEWISQAFQTASDAPVFYFGNSDNESNPLALFGKERPQQMVVGDFLGDLMAAKNDPRRLVYWVEENGKREFHKLFNTSLIRAQRSSTLALITYTELMFLKAEALLRTGDATASQVYTMALIHSMEENGITSQQYNPYLAFNAGLNLSTFEAKLERLMTQKYIALYGQNPTETWVDYRRTGYPVLEVPANATSSFNPSLVIPLRVLYPIGERTTNKENYDEAIARQGGHLMDVKMWAFE
ncbi:MAG: SusD/RagB family nutrient-binding outer membrane lipoprotein [Bacteroidetes bacterium]|nr:SusD/RagB family nutrient-binding outer membrane lipoprotein [Bacteroidota bacterium]